MNRNEWNMRALIQVVLIFCLSGLRVSSGQSSDWVVFGDYSYLFTGYIGSAYSWHEANKFCRDRGALLASVHSDEENEFLAKDKVWTRLHPTIWLGLNTLENPSQATWLDGTSVNFTKVNVSVLDNTRRCAALDSPNPTRRWLFMHCDSDGSLVCKKPKDAPPRTIPPPLTTLSLGECPEDWTRVGNKCFKLFSSKDGHSVNHSTARSRCLALGSGHDLASIHNHEENLVLTTLTSKEETNLWIGLSRISFTVFGWTDNTQLDFTNWAPGEPSSVAEGCTEFLTSKLQTGFWNDISCRQSMGYVCQGSPDLAVPTRAPPPQEQCPNSEFVRFGESCYKLFPRQNQSTWMEAERTCQKYGGHLASVHSGQEMAFFKRNILPQTNDDLWIGLKTTTKGVYFWSDGWPVKYLEFEKDFNSPENECGFLNSSGTWIVDNCNSTRGFLCKITEETRPDVPEMDYRPCPRRSSMKMTDIGLKNCYAFGFSRNWGGANMECLKNDMHLAVIHHKHELEQLSPYLINYPNGLWIGQIRKYHGGFEWVDGSSTNFTFWDASEPSTKKGDDCVILSKNQKAITKNCNDSFYYMCQISKDAAK